MAEIEHYHISAFKHQSLPSRIENRDFSEFLSKEELKKVDEHWSNQMITCDYLNAERIRVGKKSQIISSKPQSFVSLIDTHNGFNWVTTEYKMYHASTELEIPILELMRVGSIGGAVKSIDGSVIVHKRSKDAGHVPNLYDSSVGGFCVLQNGELNPANSLYQKLARELKITPEEVEDYCLTDVHHASAPDHSGMFSFVVNTKLETSALKERGEEAISRGEFGGIEIVSEKDLPDFIIEHYGGTNTRNREGTLDGAAVLASSLSSGEFTYTIKQLIKSGVDIQYGKLENNVFVPGK